MFKFLYMLVVIQALILSQAKSADLDMKTYISKFTELEKIRNDNFNKLSFTLAAHQIKKSASYKIAVTDQLGRDWLFKSGAHSSKDGAVASYRLFQLFGVKTPEVYFKTFQINGSKVEGSLQRIYVTRPRPLPFSSLNRKSQYYIAQNHALSWLTLNHHVHPDQFIQLASPEEQLEILRIDTSINWFLLGNDQLSTFYYSPLLTHAPDAGYFSFWNDFLAYDIYIKGTQNKTAPHFDKQELYLNILKRKKIDLDLEKLYSWVLVISKIPDNFYAPFFSTIEKNNFDFASNGSNTSPWFVTSEYLLNFDKKNFAKKMTKRKNEAPKDFKIFYSYLLNAKGDSTQLKGRLTSQVFSEMMSEVEREIAASKGEQTLIDQNPNQEQAPLHTDVSPITYGYLSKILVLPYTNDFKERTVVIDEIIKDLETVNVSKENKIEIEALQNAIENLKTLKKMVQENANISKVMRMVLNYNAFFEKNAFATN